MSSETEHKITVCPPGYAIGYQKYASCKVFDPDVLSPTIIKKEFNPYPDDMKIGEKHV